MGAHWTTTDTAANTVTVSRRCQWCSRWCDVTVDRDKYDRWVGGELVQNVFSEMTAEEREELVSGTHRGCWDAMWKEGFK